MYKQSIKCIHSNKVGIQFIIYMSMAGMTHAIRTQAKWSSKLTTGQKEAI